MKDPYEIITRPLLTEKSTDQAAINKYHFRVAISSNKIEIADAIERMFERDSVRVLSVNTMIVKGKRKRAMSRGAKPGYSPKWKKAVVTTDRPLVLFEGI